MKMGKVSGSRAKATDCPKWGISKNGQKPTGNGLKWKEGCVGGKWAKAHDCLWTLGRGRQNFFVLSSVK
jgi:hypothetical protein